jgi:hypothetical protein
MEGPRLRTLHKALALLEGSKPRLAVALDLSLEQLDTYLSGDQELPHQVFLDALDLVAGNGRQKR